MLEVKILSHTHYYSAKQMLGVALQQGAGIVLGSIRREAEGVTHVCYVPVPSGA